MTGGDFEEGILQRWYLADVNGVETKYLMYQVVNPVDVCCFNV